MSDPKKRPRVPPPDDFSETTPNIDIPDDDSSDWDKTSYNMPSDAPDDDWGKTVINYDSSLEPEEKDSFDDTYRSAGKPEEPDWGMTQTNIGDSFDVDDNDFGEPADVAATQHVIHIPEADRKKFKIPPSPAQQAEQKAKEEKAKGGVPLWFWLTGGLMVMFFFAVIVLVGAYFILIYDSGYEVVVQGAPIGSSFYIDNASWGLPSTRNEHRLSGLAEGRRRIDIRHAEFTCQQEEVTLRDGINPPKVTAVCSRKSGTGQTIDEKACDETRVVEDRERCAEQILDTLNNPPDLDRLVKALNWLIINFETGKWDIPEARKRILTKASTHMKNLPDSVLIEIGGHTDNVGSDANNQALSERRATAVRDFLVNITGVRSSLLTTKGYGESSPKASNDTPDGRFDNRRIEYKVMQR